MSAVKQPRGVRAWISGYRFKSVRSVFPLEEGSGEPWFPGPNGPREAGDFLKMPWRDEAEMGKEFAKS
jgi:hypothetical protein